MKRKCSICGYYLPHQLFLNPYSKGYNKICNKCVQSKIHEYMNEIKKKAGEKHV